MKPMDGIKVVEVAAWTFVPAAGAVLAEWGADVLKIERPDGGDPQRGLVSSGLVPSGASGVNFFIEQPNHGKRSVAIDLQHEKGRELLYKLCETADVFLTNWLPGPRSRAKIDVEDIKKINPNIVYVRGHGQGTKGPDADKGGYDGSAYFARSGVMHSLMTEGDPYGPTQPPAFGDLPGGQTVAGAIAAALLQRERTGEAPVVDVSLLAFGMWTASPAIVMEKLFEGQGVPKLNRASIPNPITNRYLTKDNRLVNLVMLQATRFWGEFFTKIGHPEIATDEKYATAAGIYEHREQAIRKLDEIFATKTLAEWKQILDHIEGVWAPVQTGIELYDDVQVKENGYLMDLEASNGASYQLVGNPVQFNETPNASTRAPELGEHTDDVLREIGYSDEEIIELKIENAIL